MHLSTYPDEVIDDREELHRSAARLLEYDFDALAVRRRAAPVGWEGEAAGFVEAAGEVGRLIAASRMRSVGFRGPKT
jgi:hypothetical protein